MLVVVLQLPYIFVYFCVFIGVYDRILISGFVFVVISWCYICALCTALSTVELVACVTAVGPRTGSVTSVSGFSRAPRSIQTCFWRIC